jgi:hypothetical protein
MRRLLMVRSFALPATMAALLSAPTNSALPRVRDRDRTPPASLCSPDSVITVGNRSDAETLRDISQRLLDAVAVGDTAIWSRYLADDGVFTDEEANVRDKRTVIAELRPMPSGFSGQICIASPRSIVAGDVAVLTYDALETETVYGQTLHTRFHTTDTYLRRGNEWRLLGSHTSVLPSEHTAVAPEPRLFDDYIGRYLLTPGVEYRVERDGNRLYGVRAGGQREELLPLGVDQFFRSGRPRGELIFRRDPGGRVDAMLDRRDNNDLVWRRMR